MCVVKRPAINISLVVVPPAPSPVPRVGVEDGDAPGHRARVSSRITTLKRQEYHSHEFFDKRTD